MVSPCCGYQALIQLAICIFQANVQAIAFILQIVCIGQLLQGWRYIRRNVLVVVLQQYKGRIDRTTIALFCTMLRDAPIMFASRAAGRLRVYGLSLLHFAQGQNGHQHQCSDR